MSLDRLRDLSGLMGNELLRALSELQNDADVFGGGLRHEEVEWQVHYHWNGLERYLFMSVDEPSDHLVRFVARGGVTDATGRWIYVPVASTTLPEGIIRENLGDVVHNMLQQGRLLLNTFGKEDLQPLVQNYFSQDER